MHEDADRCYRAVRSRDQRFDGWFVTAVTSTGIYCRPSCPARTPRRENVRFFPTAAAAQGAGFRACKRCRPDASPGSPEWDQRADVVARAMRLIADGAIDRDGVRGVAGRVGYSERQLERLLTAEVGSGPLALARAQRAHTARVLIETTGLSFAHVAHAAGFGSIRQFNDTVREVFATTPSEMRRRSAHPGGSPTPVDGLELRLPFRAPFGPEPLLEHLEATAVPGCEVVSGGTLRRTLRLPHGQGSVTLTPRRDHVSCRLRLDDTRDLHTAVARCRRLLDLDADPEAVDADLGAEATLAPLVHAVPGIRVPRSVDASETAVRVVVGQHVSTGSARAALGRLVERLGPRVQGADGGPDHVFPAPEQLADADLDGLGIPRARVECLRALTAALASGALDLGPGCDRDAARRDLAALPGIGPWTVEVIAMRALGDPDAFPATDAGVRAAGRRLGLDDDLGSVAARWSPWRSYATAHLWASLHPSPRQNGDRT